MPRNRGRGWYNDKPQHRLAGRGIPTKAKDKFSDIPNPNMDFIDVASVDKFVINPDDMEFLNSFTTENIDLMGDAQTGNLVISYDREKITEDEKDEFIQRLTKEMDHRWDIGDDKMATIMSIIINKTDDKIIPKADLPRDVPLNELNDAGELREE